MEIQGYENYLIYPDGRVYSKKNDMFLKHHIFKATSYKYVHLSFGKRKHHLIHRLVAQHYIPNPDNKPQVDHINRDRQDNRIENLRWVTVKENIDNKGKNKNNTSGHKNIYYDKSRKKWRFMKHNREICFMKRFKTKTEALCFKFIFLLMLKAEIPSPVSPLK